MAYCIAVVAIGIAVVGWCRPVVKVIAERPVGNWTSSDCMEYAKNVMCNN